MPLQELSTHARVLDPSTMNKNMEGIDPSVTVPLTSREITRMGCSNQRMLLKACNIVAIGAEYLQGRAR